MWTSSCSFCFPVYGRLDWCQCRAGWQLHEEVAIAALSCGRPEIAKQLIAAVDKRFPGSKRVVCLQGMASEAIGNFDDAEKLYDAALEAKATFADAMKRKVCLFRHAFVCKAWSQPPGSAQSITAMWSRSHKAHWLCMSVHRIHQNGLPVLISLMFHTRFSLRRASSALYVCADWTTYHHGGPPKGNRSCNRVSSYIPDRCQRVGPAAPPVHPKRAIGTSAILLRRASVTLARLCKHHNKPC